MRKLASLSIALSCLLLLSGDIAWAGFQPPLGNIPVPEPANLADFVKDRNAAIALGKALFWDTQVGSDGKTACATCHFTAGADNRLTNTVHPGADGVFSMSTSSVPLGPSYTLNTAFTTLYDFPFFRISPPDGRVGVDTVFDQFLNPTPAAITRDINDIVGSQGIVKTTFVSLGTGTTITAVENGTPDSDPTFTFQGHNLRQVTDRNAPSVINAVFNYTGNWDGRANNIFNGVNPFGPLDQDARIWANPGPPGGTPVQIQIAIPNGALASQAVGPPVDNVMMSYSGRTFPEIGRKLLGLTPLGLQLVHPDDSVLGALALSQVNPTTPGLDTSYAALIQSAFQDQYWNGGDVLLSKGAFSHMEANFSLFFGLSVQLYEATLVSDQSPFDRFQDGNQNALILTAQRGLASFDNRCAGCHWGSEFTIAGVGNTVPNDLPTSFTTNTNHRLIRQLQTIPPPGSLLLPEPITADTGFYNTGVRATAEDDGRGGVSPFLNSGTGAFLPLSFTRLAVLLANGQLPFATPELPPAIPAGQQDALQGSFKAPGLRNVELTAPYMHNGSMNALNEVVEFYARGGNYPVNHEMTIAPIGNLRGDPGGRGEIVEFLKALTDERVENEWAPFDHPEIVIPDGEGEFTRAAKGGIPTVIPGLTFDPILSPTTLAVLATSGTVTDDSTLTSKVTVAVQVNSDAPAAATVTGAAWNHTITNLTTLGTNTITVTATHLTGGAAALTQAIIKLPAAVISGAPAVATKLKDATLTIGGAGVTDYKVSVDGSAFSGPTPTATPIVLTDLSEGFHVVSVLGMGADPLGTVLEQPPAVPTTATWRVKSIPPVLLLDPVASLNRPSFVLSGTVELGLVPIVHADTATSIGPITVIGGSGVAKWSCPIAGLAKGTTNISVTAVDIAANITTREASTRVVYPDGDFQNTGAADISDAVKALYIAVGIDVPSFEDVLHGDVAPLENGVPAPDGAIDVSDALLILKKVVGLVSF